MLAVGLLLRHFATPALYDKERQEFLMTELDTACDQVVQKAADDLSPFPPDIDEDKNGYMHVPREDIESPPSEAGSPLAEGGTRSAALQFVKALSSNEVYQQACKHMNTVGLVVHE